MAKTARARYTLEFKEEAVRLVTGGQRVAAVAKTLGLAEQTLHNWVKAAGSGGLTGTVVPKVSAEQMEISRLRTELARVKMERDILKKSGGVFREGVAVKYTLIQRHRDLWPISVQCSTLGVSARGFRQYVRREAGTDAAPAGQRVGNLALLTHIKAIHTETRGAYGWPRVWRELRRRHVRVGKERVRRMMRDHAIRARGQRKFKATTDSTHSLPVSDNPLNRAFRPEQPDRVWTGDITYIATQEGWLYLAVVIDLFSRQVVGWALGERMTRQLVIDALAMAWFRQRPAEGMIFHSDRGSQYASSDFQALLRRYGMRGSMSRKSNCWDNAVTETLFGSLKVERLHGMRFDTRRRAKDEVIDWLGFYNHRRMHSTLGYTSPMAFEEAWRRKESTLAA
ncbi:IS3 family transposase [Azospirillum doebereinerae]|uniref:IS3 family transposase n=1 Tax=Azospirillum doebereinerae TaxID=92933 RepID=UPI003D1FF888